MFAPEHFFWPEYARIERLQAEMSKSELLHIVEKLVIGLW
jgi:hypothetical protein